MTRAPDPRELAETAARVALAVPGVAYLSPRLADRLRASPRSPGVRVLPRDATRLTTIEISLAVHAGHRATSVAHEVRTAVADALHTEHPRVWATEVSVSVTVTAIV